MVLTPQQATGKRLGAYELSREVCASSVGATYVAQGPQDHAVWLTKVHRHVAKSPALCEAFLAAAKKAATLSSPCISRVVDSGTADGEIFVAYEHHDGDTLAALLRRVGPEGLPLPVAERIVLDMLDAVRAAFAAGADLGHGEMGPFCVHVGGDGRARISGFVVDRALTRFGLHYAKNLDRLPYAAPERVKAMSLTLGPAPPVPDERADDFSVAVLAWELFTRQRLFASRMEAAVIQKVLASAIPDPKSQRPELSEMVSRALASMLAREPAERLGADELSRAIATSDVATHDEVAAFASKQVDKAQTRPLSSAPRAFSSVRPPPMAPATNGPVSRPRPINGASEPTFDAPPAAVGATTLKGSATLSEVLAAIPAPAPVPAPPPVAAASAAVEPTPSKSVPPPRALPSPRTRAKTLMGFAAAVPVPIETKPAETKPAETKPAEARHEPLAPVAASVTESSPKPVPAAPRAPIVATRVPSGSFEDATSLDDDAILEEPTSPPISVTVPLDKRPPARRPPPKPRQQTLMGIEPLASPLGESAADSGPVVHDLPTATPAPAPSPGPAPVAASPAPVVATPSPAPAVVVPAPPAAAAASATISDAPRTFGPGVDRLSPGSVLGKPPQAYQLLGIIARGGMATVWSARNTEEAERLGPKLDRVVAIKTMLPELSDDPDFETMFIDEMRVAAKIAHPNVARIVSVGEEDGVMYIVMEWVDGETFGGLQQAARSSGGIPLPVLLHMASDVCAGLHAAHELRDEGHTLLDLVHRDINPSNVVVGRDGLSRVVDFGIAKSKGRMHVTRAGSTIKGKAPYLSPEQLGGLPIDRRSDLFSLGALLYVMSTGVHPFRGDTELQTIENIVLKAPAPLRTLVPGIHPDFEKLVLRLLEKDPKKRPTNAEEVQRELDRIADAIDKRATAGDVGTFVEKMVADAMNARRAEMEAAAIRLSPAVPAPAAAAVDFDRLAFDRPAAGADGSAVDLASNGAAAATAPLEPLSAGGVAKTMPLTADDLAPPAIADAGAPPPFVFPPSTAAASDIATPASASSGIDSDFAPSARRAPSTMSPWVRLVLLIVVGIVVGIGVIALIEALRPAKPDDKASSSTPAPSTAPKANATETSKQSTGPSTATTIDVAPTPPTETAPPSSEPSSEPSTTASAAPTTKPTAERPTPGTGASKPPPPPKSSGAPKASGSAKKPPPGKKPFNPKEI